MTLIIVKIRNKTKALEKKHIDLTKYILTPDKLIMDFILLKFAII